MKHVLVMNASRFRHNTSAQALCAASLYRQNSSGAVSVLDEPWCRLIGDIDAWLMARGKWLAMLHSAQHAAEPLGLLQESASQPRSCTVDTTPGVGLEANLFEYIGVTVVVCLLVSKILMSCTPGTLLEPASSANWSSENSESVKSCDNRLLQQLPADKHAPFSVL